MTIDNDYIAEKFSLLSKLMDIHGENSFKTKSYSVAAFTLEKLPSPIAELPPAKMTSIRGIGDAIGKKIAEILETGELRLLQQYISQTPPGVIQMLPSRASDQKRSPPSGKKWKSNPSANYSMPARKTGCSSIKALVKRPSRTSGSHRILPAEPGQSSVCGNRTLCLTDRYANYKNSFNTEQSSLTGDFRRQLEIIDQTAMGHHDHSRKAATAFFTTAGFEEDPSSASSNRITGPSASALSPQIPRRHQIHSHHPRHLLLHPIPNQLQR
jgi:DNA polymerase (family 10)